MSPITSGQGMAWRHNATFMFHTVEMQPKLHDYERRRLHERRSKRADYKLQCISDDPLEGPDLIGVIEGGPQLCQIPCSG